jgi:outer membrane protein assembly factor BamA
VTFDRASEVPLPQLQDGATLLNANLSPSFTYDSRDTVFTPSRGTYLSLSGSFYQKLLGSDRDFQEVDGATIVYVPFSPRVTLGLRADGMGSFGPVPFYLRPAISLRGVTARRYIGHSVAQTEAELRYQFWKRFSIVRFAGVGTTWRESETVDSTRTVHEGGGGLRYELAWRYKLDAGVDVAWGPDGVIWYVVMGSAWNRP